MKNQQTIFAIGIPTINRKDLLQETLEKMQHDFPNTAIYIHDNGRQDFDLTKFTQGNIFFSSSDNNMGVANSWNKLLKNIYAGNKDASTKACEFAIILNDDIYLGKKELEMIRFINGNTFNLATTTLTWCAFIIPEIIYRKVGEFDGEFYPAYYEDNDYAYRMKLLGFNYSQSEFLNPLIYKNSASIEKDPSLNGLFNRNKDRYIEKWGGEPLQEKYLSPYNQLDRF